MEQERSNNETQMMHGEKAMYNTHKRVMVRSLTLDLQWSFDPDPTF
jgi:hypothetical protein